MMHLNPMEKPSGDNYYSRRKEMNARVLHIEANHYVETSIGMLHMTCITMGL